MATFNITRDGATYRVTVPDDRADSITESELAGMIDGQAAPPAASQPAPNRWTGAVRQGAGDLARGLGATFRVAGNALDDQGIRNIGEGLSGVLPEDPNYEQATPQFIEGVRNMDRRALDYFPRAVVETLPGLLATRGAARVAGPVGAVGLGAGQSFGNIAEARAANDGRPGRVTGEDMAVAGAGALGVGALEAVGVRGASQVATGLTGRVAGLGRSAAREGGTEIAEDAAQQTAETAGTERGWDVDPAQAIAAGPLGAGARAVTGAPGAVLRGSVESGVRAGAERAFGDMTPDVAESVARLNELLEQNAQLFRQRTGTDAPPDELFNAARGSLESDLRNFVTRAERAGWLDREAGEGRTMRDLVEAAVRHNRAMVDGVPTDGFSMGEGMGRLDGLRSAPAEFRAGMRTLLTDLDQLSRASRKNRMTGPFERLGDVAGRAAGIGMGAATGTPFGMAAGVGAAIAGNPIGARVGAAAGRVADRALGTRQPGLVLARRKAERLLRRDGADPGSTSRIRDNLNRLLNDDSLAERARLGLPTDPDTLAKEAAKAAERAAKREEVRQRKETESKLRAEAIAAQNEVKDRERAWQDYEARFREGGATPEQVQAILDAERRREGLRKAADAKRATKDAAVDQRPDAEQEDPSAVAQATASQEREWLATLSRNAKLVEAARRRVTRESAQADRSAEQDEAALQRAGETDAQRRAREVEEAYRQREADEVARARREADFARAAAQRAAQHPNVPTPPAPNPEPNLEAVTRDQVREWERLLDANRRAVETQNQTPVETAKKRVRRKKADTPPVDTPAPAQGEAPAPSATPAATPVARRPETPPAASQEAARPAPAETDDESTRPITDRGPMRGWMLYVRRAFESKGVPNVARQEMLAALDDAVDAGAIPEDLAEVYRTSMPTIRNSDYLDAILTRIAEARDVDLGASDVAAIRQDALDSEGTGQPQGQSFYRPDVQDPASWQGAADSRQAHVRFYSEQALAREDYAVATVLARLGTETERQFTPDERRVVARALVNAAPEGAAGFRRAAMAPWLRGEAMDDAPDPTPPPRRPAAPPPAPPPEPEADTTGTDAAIATATRRSRGRPKGTGKLQQAASAEAQAQADAAENARLVAMGVDAETLRQVEKRFNAVSQTLRAKIMEGDEKASDTLDRITEQLQLARRAHTAYRRDVIEKGSMSD